MSRPGLAALTIFLLSATMPHAPCPAQASPIISDAPSSAGGCPTCASTVSGQPLAYGKIDSLIQAGNAAWPHEVAAFMAQANFKCTEFNTKTGMTCTGRVPGYPRDVAIIMPPNFKPSDMADLILQLHGNNADNDSLPYYLKKFEYARLLAESGRNSLMVVPLSLGDKNFPTKDHMDFLGKGPEFEKFIQGIMKVISSTGLASKGEPKSLSLTSHSGGYRTVADIIKHGKCADKIKEIYLFDSSYGGYDELTEYAKTPGNRLWSVYSSRGKLKRNNTCLMRQLRSEGVAFSGCEPQRDRKDKYGKMVPVGCETAEDYRPWGNPNPFHPEMEMGSDNPKCPVKPFSPNSVELQANRVGFLQVDADHTDTYKKTFSTLLRPPLAEGL